MPRGLRNLSSVLPLALFLIVASCGKDSTRPSGMVPDFQLKDVNPNSATFQQTVSPRDELEKVSAWYFGHAT